MQAHAFTSTLALLTVLAGCSKLSPNQSETQQSTASPKSSATSAASAKPTAAKSTDLPAPADVAAAPPTAEVTPSGLASVVLTKGTGSEKPTEYDSVKVHYSGWTKDGKMFDSSVVRGEPATFGVGGVIKGWTEALQLMTVGEKRRLWIPGALAYGDTPRRPGSPSGQLTFDVELLQIIAGPKPPPVPADVAAAPANAKKTKSGLAYVVLTKGSGKVHPTAEQMVQVHYTGWTTDGKMFDSSVMRGRPMPLALNNVIKGWTEGLQLMVEGEKTRFWIPADLAYGDKPTRPGAPSGTLVFDIELVKLMGGAGPSPLGSAHPGARPTTVVPGGTNAAGSVRGTPGSTPASNVPPPAGTPPKPVK